MVSRYCQGPQSEPLTCLYEITSAIHSTLDLRKALYRVLDLLSQYLGMKRGSITLLNPERSEIHIEVAHGISSAAKAKGRYKLGEGITGRVIASGKPIAVPDRTTKGKEKISLQSSAALLPRKWACLSG